MLIVRDKRNCPTRDLSITGGKGDLIYYLYNDFCWVLFMFHNKYFVSTKSTELSFFIVAFRTVKILNLVPPINLSFASWSLELHQIVVACIRVFYWWWSVDVYCLLSSCIAITTVCPLGQEVVAASGRLAG